MSYHIYTTDGIILKRTPFGEANILVHVLTTDLGLIVASVQAGRLSVSKLRPALQEYTHVSISCVKGKGGWKVTNVVSKNNFFFDLPEYCHTVLAQVVSVLIKMIPGETPHPEIFRSVQGGFEFLKNITEQDIPHFEILIVLRILYHLGYVVSDKETREFLENINVWNTSLLSNIALQKREVVVRINKALQASQL